jgi:hypothetical protein
MRVKNKKPMEGISVYAEILECEGALCASMRGLIRGGSNDLPGHLNSAKTYDTVQGKEEGGRQS